MIHKFTQNTLGILLVSYIFFRVLFLSRLPLFNDESIYLDWGWKEIHIPGALFYSLSDGKQPLLMWVFGIVQSIITDPLIAGRSVTVAAGLVTLVGIYKLSSDYFSKEIAVLSSLLYIAIPIFTIYDRLALMESSISACGVWSLYFYLKLREQRSSKFAVILGIILGVGYFIKANAILFLGAVIILECYGFFKSSEKRKLIISSLGGIILSFILTISLLLLQPIYWKSLSMNSRYSLTPSELLHFPIIHFLNNGWVNLQILFFFVTPLVMVLSLYGLSKLQKLTTKQQKVVFLWVVLTILLQTLLVRSTSQRYLVSYLPLLTIPVSYALVEFTKKCKVNLRAVAVILLVVPLVMSVWIMVDPLTSSLHFKKMTPSTDTGLVEGQTSGYGLKEVVQKLNTLTQSSPAYLVTAINIGNPESAIPIYFHHSPVIKTGYLDKKLFGPGLASYECIRSTVPIYYISRDQQQSDMNEYLEEVFRIYHPKGGYSLGIYQLRANCSGSILEIDPV